MEKKTQLTFFEHLDELRKCIFLSLGAVLAGTVAGYFFSDRALEILIRPARPQMNEIYFFYPAEAFLVKFKIAFLMGLVVTSPVWVSQVWRFVSPALYEKERKIITPLILAFSVLFVSGVLFCFYFVMPFTLKFLIGMRTEFLKPMISLTNYVDFMLGMLIAFGVAFNLPLVILALVFLGLVTTKALNRYQRHAIVLIFIVAAVLTPTPDISGQILLAIPLILLFELSVIGGIVIERIRKKRHVIARRSPVATDEAISG